ncbi:hypothetical protein P9112_000801 [Eukaryota sp. TZLM1-RC]
MKEGHFSRSDFVGFLKDLIRDGVTYRFPGPRSVLILDGCRIHRSPEIFAAVSKTGIKYILLPPYSPECNPIESFFSILRRRVRNEAKLYPDVPATQIIFSCLESLRNYNCTSLFNHSGYVEQQNYKSPYLHSERLKKFVSTD